MAPSEKLEETKFILDLHENIFHEIFKFLNYDTIYFKLRGVCRKLRIYADSFIQLGGVFMFLGQQSSQLLHMYKRKENAFFICMSSMKPNSRILHRIQYKMAMLFGEFSMIELLQEVS